MCEILENRTLLSAALSAHTIAEAAATPPLAFKGNYAAAHGYLTNSNDVDMAAVNLTAGDVVNVSVDAQSVGSGLDSALCVFNAAGQPIASNDNFNGTDSEATFQASQTGTYYVGVSGFGNLNYNPTQPPPAVPNSPGGLFNLQLYKESQALLPDLIGALFGLQESMAVWSDTVHVNYSIENRGGTAFTSPFQVKLVLSTNNRFDGTGFDLVRGTPITVNGLAAGQSYQVAGLALSLPAAPPSGFAASQAVYLGVEIETGGATELNDPQQGVERGGDNWVRLQMLTQTNAVAGTTDSSAAVLPLNSRQTATLSAGNTDYYQVTLTEPGRLTIQAGPAGSSLMPQLALASVFTVPDPGSSTPTTDDQLIDNSDQTAPGALGAEIVQGLPAGTYVITVSSGAAFGTPAAQGSYALATTFVSSSLSDRPFPINSPSAFNVSMVQADFTGDGVMDFASVDNNGDLNVALGLGDGTFQVLPSVNLSSRIAINVEALQLFAGHFFAGNSYLDLALWSKGSLTLLRGQGTAPLSLNRRFPCPELPFTSTTTRPTRSWPRQH